MEVKFEDLILDIETNYSSWNWLVRSDREGYFANIYNDGSTIVNPSYATSVVGALQGSLEMLQEYLLDNSRPRKSDKEMMM